MRLLPIIIFMLLVFSSCKKNLDQDESFNKFTTSFITLKNSNDQRVAYALLTNPEKQKLWNLKLNKILENNDQVLSSDQRMIILYLKEILSTIGIEKLSSEPAIGESIINSNLTNWKNSFSNKQLFYLIENPSYDPSATLSSLDAEAVNTEIDTGESIIDPEAKNCQCLYDIGCGFGNLCMIGTGYSCSQVTGCGLFGTSNCKGLCV